MFKIKVLDLRKAYFLSSVLTYFFINLMAFDMSDYNLGNGNN